MEEIETRKARGATIRARVKWQQVGDKCSAEFFKSVRQKNSQSIISELRDEHGRCFTRKEDLDKICLDFYSNLYKHKEILEEAFEVVAEFEAIISLASLRINFPGWAVPEIANGEGYTLKAVQIAHPLIDVGSRVANNYDLTDTFKIDFLHQR